jgi:diguanylate cyclase (GGDEF)-like protein
MQAVRDPLTGLYNRRYMEETLEREIRRAERRYASLGVIMLDVDHFKRFNDTFGHAAGDTLLQELGSFLMGHIRGEDIACRYGGEEFALILPDASLEGACGRADDLRERIKALGIAHRGQPLGAVTVSMGVAAYPDHGHTGEELLRAADAALYEAKAQGRDRVVVSKRPG